MVEKQQGSQNLFHRFLKRTLVILTTLSSCIRQSGQKTMEVRGMTYFVLRSKKTLSIPNPRDTSNIFIGNMSLYSSRTSQDLSVPILNHTGSGLKILQYQ